MVIHETLSVTCRMDFVKWTITSVKICRHQKFLCSFHVVWNRAKISDFPYFAWEHFSRESVSPFIRGEFGRAQMDNSIRCYLLWVRIFPICRTEAETHAHVYVEVYWLIFCLPLMSWMMGMVCCFNAKQIHDRKLFYSTDCRNKITPTTTIEHNLTFGFRKCAQMKKEEGLSRKFSCGLPNP